MGPIEGKVFGGGNKWTMKKVELELLGPYQISKRCKTCLCIVVSNRKAENVWGKNGRNIVKYRRIKTERESCVWKTVRSRVSAYKRCFCNEYSPIEGKILEKNRKSPVEHEGIAGKTNRGSRKLKLWNRITFLGSAARNRVFLKILSNSMNLESSANVPSRVLFVFRCTQGTSSFSR